MSKAIDTLQVGILSAELVVFAGLNGDTIEASRLAMQSALAFQQFEYMQYGARLLRSGDARGEQPA